MIKYKNMPKLFWITGQSGSGKSELAKELKTKLIREQTVLQQNLIAKEIWGDNVPNNKFIVIDENDLRYLYKFHDLSKNGIIEFVSFTQVMCSFLIKNNFIPIVAIVSPYYEQRKKFITDNGGLEICVVRNKSELNSDMYIDDYENSLEDENTILIDTSEKQIFDSFDELWKNILNN